MRKLVIGDIHGGYRSLMQALERANFNEKEDLLIGLGDYVDGWSESFQVVEYLRKLPNFTGVLGNHDDFFLNYLNTFIRERIWTSQGGKQTLKSYKNKTEYFDLHKVFLENLPLFLEIDNKLFVHGGFKNHPITHNNKFTLTWDRNLFTKVFSNKYIVEIGTRYDEIFIGHTTTSRLKPDLTPAFKDGLWALDQGAGFEGKLTIMDIHTHEYWQSDLAEKLYPEEKGRR